MNKIKYDILANENDDIIIMIDKPDGEPHNPKLYYDDKNLLALRRNDKMILPFENPSKKAKEVLNKVKDIRIIEIEDEDIVYEYDTNLCIKNDLKHYLEEEND